MIIEGHKIVTADCREFLATLKPDCIDSFVQDPPYGLGFMGKTWDFAVPGSEYFEAQLRVAKPGAHLVAFGGTRTYHRLTCAIEDAGWELRDCLMWLYGEGYPKAKSILKPAWEPIILARKPFKGSATKNVLEHGTGALNIDGCRIETADNLNGGAYSGGDKDPSAASSYATGVDAGEYRQPIGRWPANVIMDPEAGAMLDEQTGTLKSGAMASGTARAPHSGSALGAHSGNSTDTDIIASRGGASRFFYSSKASGREREAGLEDFEQNEAGRSNVHPTVKPIDLMRWLVKLITPPGGLVCDPFCGTGSTGCAAMIEGFNFLGIEREPKSAAVADARLQEWTQQSGLLWSMMRDKHEI